MTPAAWFRARGSCNLLVRTIHLGTLVLQSHYETFLIQVDGLGKHVPGNWGYCSCSLPTIGSVPRGPDCSAAASSSLRGEVINLSPDLKELKINARGDDAVIFPTSKPSTAQLPTVDPIIVPEEPDEVERTFVESLTATADAKEDDDPLVGGRFDKCFGFEVLPFPFNDSGTFLPNENECIPFVSAFESPCSVAQQD